MKRSATATVDKDPALLPDQDGARAVMILGKDDGAAVVLRVNALSMEDTARLGTGGIYLQLAGVRGTSLASAIAAAAKFKDDDVCVYLDDAARKDLAEQLSRFQTILDLHTVMAQRAGGDTEQARVMQQLLARSQNSPFARRRAIVRDVRG